MIEPIRRQVVVRCPPERAFKVFSEDMSTWWPVDRFSRAAEGEFGAGVKVERVVVEPRTGGRFYEVTSDGREASWGEVQVYEPPRRIVLGWNPSPLERPYTEIKVTFTQDSDRTVVSLEHRGWERLGDAGVSLRETYVPGWALVLDEGYVRAAERVD